MKKSLIPVIDIKKYGGRQVAVYRGKIIASGVTAQETLGKARKRAPAATWQEILLVSVPKGLTMVFKL